MVCFDWLWWQSWSSLVREEILDVKAYINGYYNLVVNENVSDNLVWVRMGS